MDNCKNCGKIKDVERTRIFKEVEKFMDEKYPPNQYKIFNQQFTGFIKAIIYEKESANVQLPVLNDKQIENKHEDK